MTNQDKAELFEQIMADYGIIQLTTLREYTSGHITYPKCFSAVINNGRRIFGETVSDILEQI